MMSEADVALYFQKLLAFNYIDETYPYWGPPLFEITRFRKAGGILSKRISLASDGTLESDGTACTMTQGTAWRTTCDTLDELADDIAAMPSDEAIALGRCAMTCPTK